MDRLAAIRSADVTKFDSQEYLQQIMVQLGFNTEILNEQPRIVRENGGGLRIWQYPNQFSRFLTDVVNKYAICSYLEIGCRWGGTFVLMSEYLRLRSSSDVTTVAVDIFRLEGAVVLEYCDTVANATFLEMSSTSDAYKRFIAERHFDMIFIDGDHSYAGVKADFEINKAHGHMFVFHDIVNSACMGVNQFWNELREAASDEFVFYEFTDQYAEVYKTCERAYLGIGVAIKKSVPRL